jgi:hypothetical protein
VGTRSGTQRIGVEMETAQEAELPWLVQKGQQQLLLVDGVYTPARLSASVQRRFRTGCVSDRLTGVHSLNAMNTRSGFYPST